MPFAGFWIRCAAKLIDGLLVGAVNYIIAFILVHIFPQLVIGPAPGLNTPYLVNLFCGFAFGSFYATWLVGQYGGTVGKLAFGIRIVMEDGAPVSYGRAFGRYWAEMLSSLTFGIGYLMVAFDEEKRSLHDRVCKTRVIYNKVEEVVG